MNNGNITACLKGIDAKIFLTKLFPLQTPSIGSNNLIKIRLVYILLDNAYCRSLIFDLIKGVQKNNNLTPSNIINEGEGARYGADSMLIKCSHTPLDPHLN